MIWPMHWGKNFGANVLPGFLGILLSALILPLLGYIALGSGKGTFYQLSERVGKTFAELFCSVTINKDEKTLTLT